MQILWFMTQQKLHSVRSTGTATGIRMSPDLPFYVRRSGLRDYVQAARLR